MLAAGFVNAILYSTTRKIVSISALLPFARFIRIVSSRHEQQSTGIAEASLDEMEFSSPRFDHGVLKFVSESIPGGPEEPRDKWPPQPGDELPEYLGTELAKSKYTSWVTLSDSADEQSDSEDIAEAYTTPKEMRMLSPKQCSLAPHTQSTLSPPASQLHKDNRMDIKQPSLSDSSAATYGASSPFSPPFCKPHKETELDTQTQDLSESSSSTDGTPSPHHKRFSGWSFPSLPDISHEEDSVHMELEEMRFASPSPERIYKKLPGPSRSMSTTELRCVTWPSRSGTFD